MTTPVTLGAGLRLDATLATTRGSALVRTVEAAETRMETFIRTLEPVTGTRLMMLAGTIWQAARLSMTERRTLEVTLAAGTMVPELEARIGTGRTEGEALPTRMEFMRVPRSAADVATPMLVAAVMKAEFQGSLEMLA